MERLYVLDVFRVGDIPVSVTDIPNFTTFIANNNFLIYMPVQCRFVRIFPKCLTLMYLG